MKKKLDINNQQKYPLIRQLLKEIPGVNKLHNLLAFNEFTNYMVDKYSFKISRDDARKRELDDEKEMFKNEAFSKKFDNFINSWNNIKSQATKYKCRQEMPVKSLNCHEKLIYFLNDNGELGGGMYLAAACQNFIEWQNIFLQPIIDIYTFNGILHHYVDNLKKKIAVQDAKNEQILLIEERFNSSKYIDLKDIIYSFSERKIFSDNGKINYADYNSFEYDYETIEDELGKILLPGICEFDNEDNLNFIIFWSEGFRGERTEILSKFYMKYPQKDLNNDEKENIVNYINKMNKENMEKNNIKYDFKEFFGSMQIIIFYITEKVTFKKDDKIALIFDNPPPFLKISDDCKNFFLCEGNKFTNDKLISLFFFFEHLCFEDLAETIQPEYLKQIPEEKKNEIINKLIKNYNNKLYALKDLASAVRRFISRYLAGRLQTIDINENLELPYQLSRADLWDEKIGNNENLMDIVNMQLNEFKLTVSQAFAFYQLIGEEDQNEIRKVVEKKEEKKKEKKRRKKGRRKN